MTSFQQKLDQALTGFDSNVHTSIVDLFSTPPSSDIQVSEQSLTRFAEQLQLSLGEIQKMKSVAIDVLQDIIRPLSNSGNILKIVVSECHLAGAGRFADSGIDIVVLFREDEDLTATTDMIRSRINDVLSGTTGGRAQQLPQTGLAFGPTHSTVLHTEFQGVPVYVAVGHCFDPTSEKKNREVIWKIIDELDKQERLKKSHLDQFAVDLYESSTIFMNNHVAPEDPGSAEPTPHDKFVQGALRLARAWRQSCMSRRDAQFSAFDAWMIMLHVIHNEAEKRKPGMAGTINGIRKLVKEIFKGKEQSPELAHPGEPLSMKQVFEQFLTRISNPGNINIHFNDFYSADKIPDWIMHQRPLLLDPSCPYRNTLYNLHKQVNDDVRKHAQESLKTLNQSGATLSDLFPLPAKRKGGA